MIKNTASPAALESNSVAQNDRFQMFFEDIVNSALSAGGECMTLRTNRGDRILGQASNNANNLILEVYDKEFFSRVIRYGNLGMGEAYMDGYFSVSNGKLPELLTCLLRNKIDKKIRGDWKMILRYLSMLPGRSSASRQKNVRRHYDIGDSVFETFLEDEYMVYSCGYAKHENDSISELQTQKLDRICQKLKLFEGATLLDVGCGNGGLVVHAAKHYGVVATGITNSKSHSCRAKAHAEKYCVQDQVNIVLGDFSEVRGKFDRIVSVGMLEHVPATAYQQYFQMINQSLQANGWALVHAIGKNAHINRHDPFIQKYIFPGSDTPKLSVLAKNIESLDMAIIDVENIVRHYAVTTRRWLDAFIANKGRLDSNIYDDSFKRMWEYYLSCGIAVALAGDLSVNQVLFTKDYHSAYNYQRI
jgi:cyclopropane-fatty-acyl-phospholipid synthase